MPWRKVSIPWSEASQGLGLVGLHIDEADHRILGASVTWDRGEVNPYGGLLRTSFFMQTQPTDEQLQRLIRAIAAGWLLHWKPVGLTYSPGLLIERDGQTEKGELVTFDIVGEKCFHDVGKLTVKLPIQENHLLSTDGYLYRKMGWDRQLVRYKSLLPVLEEAVQCFGFQTKKREPTQEVPVAVVCISPMFTDNIHQVYAMLEQAVELGCKITLSLQVRDFPGRYYASVSLEKTDGEWVFTASVVGGTQSWRTVMIGWIRDYAADLIPPDAKVEYLERYTEAPKEPRFRLPSGKLGAALGVVLGIVGAPAALVLGVLGRVYSAGERLLSAARSITWQPIVSRLEEHRRAEEARKRQLATVFDEMEVPSNSGRVEACFLAVDEDIEKDPVAVMAKLSLDEAGPKTAADVGGEG